jgi:hypothetical protein
LKDLRLEALSILPPTSNLQPLTHDVYFFKKGVSKSIGTGKMVVEFFSVATSVKV